MSRRILHTLFATTALTLALPSAASAQTAPPDGTEAADSGDIIVTARRERESVQNIPVSVQAVTGETIQKLAITNASEIAKLAPGLSLTGTRPDDPVIVLRGVRWAPGSGTPAIPVYLNEIPFDPGTTIQSIFDVGQIEVLRGPQGTTRGAPSISGAITITTRHPDLTEIGGYIQALYGTADHWNIQGALNIPIVKDMLAIRVAANLEDSELNRVYSVHSTVKPLLRNRTVRVTALFKPTDTLTFEAMYQRRRQLSRSFDQVAGTGSPGLAALRIPANFNGPALTTADRASVQDAPNFRNNDIDFITASASWDILGQQLNYNYGRQINLSPSNSFRGEQDPANVLPGFAPYQSVNNRGTPHFHTQEVRLSSIRTPGRFFDYDIGFFQKHSGGTLDVPVSAYLPGAFGAPFVTLPGAVTTPVSRYVLPVNTAISTGQVYDSFYGNLQLHLGNNTELSGGVRHIRDRVPVTLEIAQGSGFVTFPTFLPPASGGCPAPGFLPPSPVYGAAYCDAPVPASNSTTGISLHNTYHATIYNFSLSHRFSDSVLAYATTGSSYRSGLPAIGQIGLDPNLFIPKPETAKSYELGVKTNWGRHVRINANVFQIDYKNQLSQFENIAFRRTTDGSIGRTSYAFYRNVDAQVRGFELELYAEPIVNLMLDANLSYSKIKSQGGLVPCNDATRPLTAANPMNFCPSVKGQTLNASAPFQATLNGSYTVPLGSFDGYFRFNFNYQGDNPNFGASVNKTKAYGLVDLFAGVTGNKGGWDLGVYAKNVFNKQVELTNLPQANSVYALFAAPTGYSIVTTTLPREVGVTLRYAFGSR